MIDDDLYHDYILIHPSENITIVKVILYCTYYEAVDKSRKFEKDFGFIGNVHIWPVSSLEYRYLRRLINLNEAMTNLILIKETCDIDIYDIINKIIEKMDEYCKKLDRFDFNHDTVFLRE